MQRIIRLLPALLILVNVSWSQAPGQQRTGVTAPVIEVQPAETRDSILAFTPPGLDAVAHQAEVSNSFVFDRTALRAMQMILPDSPDGIRPAIHKLDGISVRLYRFHDLGSIDQARLDDVRQAYNAHGWQHLVHKGPADGLHKRTDLWLTFDGMEVRGGAMMLVTPKTLSLVTFAGNINPIDVLRLRGHFGIPSTSDSPQAAR